ncbi:MAG: T9SS type A sorting domain-containing protein [Ignavibacteriales bacterium]|nr:T9SS type A sorting domain-containing protein [Ignavibacteriales bacterium]
MGPLNVVGRMISVAVNPRNGNTVYAGSASGGLWRSYTGGLAGDWQRIPTGYPVLGVAAIAIDSSDTNTIYIGTGEVYRYQGTFGGLAIRTTRGSYGLGILKTTNGGSTWTKSLDWSMNQERGVQAIRINPLNRSTIYAATTEGIYRSYDAGTSWTLVLPVVMGEDLVINSADTTLMIASCGNFSSPGVGLYGTLNAGSDWFQLLNGLPEYSGKTLLEPYASNPSTVYASIADSTTGVGGLYRTTDFGFSWSLVNSTSISGVQGWYSHFVAVHPLDYNNIVRGGVGIQKSTDGGASFFGASGSWSDHHNYAHDPSHPDILYVVDDGGVWRSEDFGDSYFDVGYGLQTTQFYNGFSNSATDSLLALGHVQDHFGFRYQGTTSWVGGGIDEVGWTAIDQSNDNFMYAVGREGGGVGRTTDRGGRWSITGLSGFGCWNSPVVHCTSEHLVAYVGKDAIFKTTDAGSTWNKTNNGNALDGNPALSMAISPTHSDTVYIGTVPLFNRAHIFRTTTGGSNWQDITDTLPNRYPMDIAVDPHNSQTVYVAFGGYGAGHLFKSIDAGIHWSDITGTLPDVHTTAVVVDPLNSDIVYLGNDIGVYVSTNTGATWTPYDDGLPEAVLIADLVISPSNRMLRAATHGNGVYQRKLLSPVTGVEVGPSASVPERFELFQNYPNPFNPTTTIRYELSKASKVTLTVYDVLGNKISTLVDANETAGRKSIEWNAADLASGVYIYTLRTPESVQSRKMVLVR